MINCHAFRNFHIRIDPFNAIKSIFRETLLCPAIWGLMNEQLIKALTACAVTVETDCDKMSKKYLQECIKIDVFAAGHFVAFPPTIKLSDGDCMYTSNLLQLLCIEYIEVFHTLISYPSQGKALTIAEQMGKKVDYVITVSMDQLFPRSKVKGVAYYVVGFLGG